ncbi:lysophospholipid acyltransferase family protein [Stratiformator vulcanicus]|uniref:DUF374 domain-containing protein n=1 Tax=Stratiformator vulcanicus TaxID=2527980 RepID=A0A517QWQ3_9PLAN|nr:lysophospholipid acyltransferase family protein [Stratiformator vulcanicus]QDT36096.1 hypothetical protein Pan189_04510 [Stratiformator vulcanicus]
MKIRNRLLNKLLAHSAAFALRLATRSCRPVFHVAEAGTNIFDEDTGGRYLVSFWHDQIVPYVFIRKPRYIAGLVSRHRDGEYLADGMKAVGIRPIRGSSKNGGASAIQQMIRDAEGYHIAITPDGPRGPRRQMKQGIVYLASRMKRPIVPTFTVCEKAWTIKGNWTDLVIPKPFSRVHMIGRPFFHVPPDLKRDELEPWIQKLQAEMDLLEQQGQAILEGRDPCIEQVETRAAA